MTDRNKCLTDLNLLQLDIVSERKIKTIKCSSIKKNNFFILKKFSFHLFIYIACYNETKSNKLKHIK